MFVESIEGDVYFLSEVCLEYGKAMDDFRDPGQPDFPKGVFRLFGQERMIDPNPRRHIITVEAAFKYRQAVRQY